MPVEPCVRPWAYAQPVRHCTGAEAETILKDRTHIAGAYDLREIARAKLYNQYRNYVKMTVDVLVFGSARDAFGYYSLQRFKAGNVEIEPKLGTQGFSSPGLLTCFSGPYVVQCRSNRKTPQSWKAMMWLTGLILQGLPGRADRWPAELDLFPPNGLRPDTQRLVRPAVLDQDYLGEGWVARYRYLGLDYQLVLIPSDFPLAARSRLARLRDRLAGYGQIMPAPPGLGDEALAGKEAGLGEVVATVAGSWLVMTVDCPDPDEAARVLSAAGRRIIQSHHGAASAERAGTGQSRREHPRGRKS